MPVIATFSIVARDSHNGDLGIAVQSKFLAVGAIVPWVQADVGAVATQAHANICFGPDGLTLLTKGLSAKEVVAQLLVDDDQAHERQLAVVDAQGQAAAYTGSGCMPWAGHYVGEGFCVQGNILASAKVVQAMADCFVEAEGELADRLVAALAAGQAEGGDRRGRQAAAVYVARRNGSYGGNHDRYIDLRVDDHFDPIGELQRLLALHRFYLTPPTRETLTPITESLASELQTILNEAGFYSGPIDGRFETVTRSALETYAGVENLEMRLVDLNLNLIDPLIIDFMRRRLLVE